MFGFLKLCVRRPAGINSFLSILMTTVEGPVSLAVSSSGADRGEPSLAGLTGGAVRAV